MLTKRCTKCGLVKNLTEFAYNRARTDGLQSSCCECRKKWFQEHYKQNKGYYVDKAKKQKQEFFEWFKEFKKLLKCSECGFDHPAALDFHHTDPTIKEDSVARLVIIGNKKKLMDEIAKCVVLCSNCHRIKHYNEREVE